MGNSEQVPWSISGQAAHGTKGLGFSMDAASPWIAGALFWERHDWA